MSQAAKLVPGRPHASTLWRWCRKGIKSRTGERVHLDHRRVGRHLYTTKAALNEFFAGVSEADLGHFENVNYKLTSIPAPMNESQRKRVIRDADRRLEAEGF